MCFLDVTFSTLCPSSPIACVNPSETILELDVFGATAGILGLILFNFAWNQGCHQRLGLIGMHSHISSGNRLHGTLLPVELNWASAPLNPLRSARRGEHVHHSGYIRQLGQLWHLVFLLPGRLSWKSVVRLRCWPWHTSRLELSPALWLPY